MNIYGKIRKKIGGLTLDKKIKLFFAVFIMLVAVIIASVTLAVTTSRNIKNAKEMAAQKIDIVVSSIVQEMNALAAQGLGLAMNAIVQEYLVNTNDDKMTALTNEVRSVVQTVLDGQPNLNMIEIFQEDGQKVFFRSYSGYYDARFMVRKAYSEAIDGGKSQIKINYTNRFSSNGEYTLTMYIPIYSTTVLNKKIGVLAMNFDCSGLGWTGKSEGTMPFETYILDREGRCFMAENKEKIGTKVLGLTIEKMGGKDLEDNQTLYMYRKVDGWQLYLVGEIGITYILKDSISIIGLICILVVFVLAASFAAGSRLVGHMYRPMDKVVRAMAQINENHMDLRMSDSEGGQDFAKVAEGFNEMIERLSKAMNTIKEEQTAIQKLRFSALQSQIQPHFLYNTLECIHWQAVVLKDKDLSAMVKALAGYYRIVLSKGRDIITLGEELNLVGDYMTIQNLRYDHIIDYRNCVDERFYQYSIPKITLQPLVENAIYHGIRSKEGRKGSIQIKAREENGYLIISVIDSGQNIDEAQIQCMNDSLNEKNENIGYGISNVHKRIRLEFGEIYGLHYKKNSCHGVTAEVFLPEERKEAGYEKDYNC